MRLTPVDLGSPQEELCLQISAKLSQAGVKDIACLPLAIKIMGMCQSYLDSIESKDTQKTETQPFCRRSPITHAGMKDGRFEQLNQNL